MQSSKAAAAILLVSNKKTASFMQYPQENYHPLTTEPAAALNDTLTCKTIWGKPYKKLRQYYLIWFNPGVI